MRRNLSPLPGSFSIAMMFFIGIHFLLRSFREDSNLVFLGLGTAAITVGLVWLYRWKEACRRDVPGKNSIQWK
jgi:hypothetical protein